MADEQNARTFVDVIVVGDVDGYFLEFDSPRAGNFAPLRYLPRGKRLNLGLISTKIVELEQADGLKRRIDEAAAYVPLDQLGISPQCGFSRKDSGFHPQQAKSDDKPDHREYR